MNYKTSYLLALAVLSIVGSSYGMEPQGNTEEYELRLAQEEEYRRKKDDKKPFREPSKAVRGLGDDEKGELSKMPERGTFTPREE